jgi:hypothetical protein
MAPHRNPPPGESGGPAHREVWLRDLDGYTVVLASPTVRPRNPLGIRRAGVAMPGRRPERVEARTDRRG